MTTEQILTLDRGRLRTGKYTLWAAELSDEEIFSFLWLFGEFGIRTSAASVQDLLREKGRARNGLLGAMEFVHGNPLSLYESMNRVKSIKD